MLLSSVKKFFFPVNEAEGQNRMERQEQTFQKSLITQHTHYFAGEDFSWRTLVYKCAFIFLDTF